MRRDTSYERGLAIKVLIALAIVAALVAIRLLGFLADRPLAEQLRLTLGGVCRPTKAVPPMIRMRMQEG